MDQSLRDREVAVPNLNIGVGPVDAEHFVVVLTRALSSTGRRSFSRNRNHG
jgi:hypothetical protein